MPKKLTRLKVAYSKQIQILRALGLEEYPLAKICLNAEKERYYVDIYKTDDDDNIIMLQKNKDSPAVAQKYRVDIEWDHDR
ncbi:MAG: hypothetical protein LC723_13365 [Actinobacteria bacterium]|nr:hypothetical protein [Actinomycetota bacterium]